jgi:hypothetical protein
VSLSLATRIPFRALAEEDEQTLLTYFQLLDEQAEESRRAR